MDEFKKIISVYNKIAKSYAKDFSEPSEYIERFLDLLPQKAKIIDIGCGNGVDSGFMELKGFKVIGIDLSKGMLSIAKKKFPQIDFREEDIRKINFPINSFDGILASYSLIYLPKKDVSLLLKKFNQILKENGTIYLSLQMGKSEEIFINEPLKPDEKLFLNIVSFKEIKNLLTKNGFSIIKYYKREPKLKKELNYNKLFVIAKK